MRIGKLICIVVVAAACNTTPKQTIRDFSEGLPGTAGQLENSELKTKEFNRFSISRYASSGFHDGFVATPLAIETGELYTSSSFRSVISAVSPEASKHLGAGDQYRFWADLSLPTGLAGGVILGVAGLNPIGGIFLIGGLAGNIILSPFAERQYELAVHSYNSDLHKRLYVQTATAEAKP